MNAAEKARAKRLADNYGGLTLEDYAKIEAFQQHGCGVCGRGTRGKLHVDHCHRTGLVRGLLCPRHNKGLAKFNDDPILLARAAEYLLKPPAVEALGFERRGFAGRCGTRRHRAALAKERASDSS